MELELLSFPLLCLLTSLLLLFTTWKKIMKTSNKPLKLPPGPNKLPIIGNIHLLAGSPRHRRLRDLARQYGPIMHLQLGEVPTVVISSPEAAKEIMKTHDLIFAQRPSLLAVDIVTYGQLDVGFAPFGDYWRQVRKICVLELLSLKRVLLFRPIREQEVVNVVRCVASSAGTAINISKMLMSLAYSITARAAFGQKCKDQDAFIPAIQQVMEMAGGFSVADVFPSIKWIPGINGMKGRLMKLHQKVDKILENILADHRASRAARLLAGDEGEANDDLVHVLLNLQDHGDLEFPLTDDNIKAVILDMFTAGSETSSTTLLWAMSELLRNPTAMAKAQAEVRLAFDTKGNVDEQGLAELKYLKLVIKETLRLHPPLPLLVPRESRQQCKINGYDIPLKTRVLINVWGLGRDPKYWTEPDKFCPERFLGSSIDYKGVNFEYLPFGAGRRMCPGILFGMAAVELPLAQLLYHFDWKLADGMMNEDVDMTEQHLGSTVRRKYDLWLIPTPHLRS